ncbi:fasciclin domain-containing protein [Robertkochia aurantiaca]|uniref:fasciclin domain-containing protein n=1 Tax=Robertkochia aurantiaca TaxID=2873700 RepID=UPI001CCB0EB0|nr:fasciclin domain-containing protein [Robertkochia sp. 3YJGBD-33]
MKPLRLFKSRSPISSLFLALLLVTGFASCTTEQDDMELDFNQDASIMEVLYAASDSDKSSAEKPANAPGDQTIAELANTSILVAALEQVGLAEVFANEDVQLTVFAPTDQAFLDLLGSDLAKEQGWNGLADIPDDVLTTVLLYHVTEGRRASNSVVPNGKKNKKIQTLLEGSSFMVTGAPVIEADLNTSTFSAVDISASNGIIHSINAVILPEAVLALLDQE